jgi:hypothetical protein
MCVRQVPNVWWLPWGMFNPDRPAHVHITWRNLWSHAYGAKTPAKCEPTPPMDPVAGYQPRYRALCLPPSLCLLACCTLASVGGSTCQLFFVRLIVCLFVCLFVCARYIWLHDSLKDVVVTPYLTERTDAYFVLSKKVRPSLASCQQYPIERATPARTPHPPPRACATCTCTPYLRCSPVYTAGCRSTRGCQRTPRPRASSRRTASTLPTSATARTGALPPAVPTAQQPVGARSPCHAMLVGAHLLACARLRARVFA